MLDAGFTKFPETLVVDKTPSIFLHFLQNIMFSVRISFAQVV